MPEFKTQEELDAYIEGMESDMREAAKKFEFEKAAKFMTLSVNCGQMNFYLRNC